MHQVMHFGTDLILHEWLRVIYDRDGSKVDLNICENFNAFQLVIAKVTGLNKNCYHGRAMEMTESRFGG